MNKETKIEKIESQAAGERAAGNLAAAETFEAKAKAMRKKYNLPAQQTEPVKVAPAKVQTSVDPFCNFPGVSAPEKPLSNSQLAALRDEAKRLGRGLTDAEYCAVLGMKYDPPAKQRRAESELLYV